MKQKTEWKEYDAIFSGYALHLTALFLHLTRLMAQLAGKAVYRIFSMAYGVYKERRGVHGKNN